VITAFEFKGNRTERLFRTAFSCWCDRVR